MDKQLNIKITKCHDCPYFEETYRRYSDATYTNHDEFKCKLKSPPWMKIDPKVYLQYNFLHEDCPLPDVREQGVQVGVSMFLVNDKNQILVGLRPDGTWGLPGGGMRAGEIPPEAGIRETEEETSITCEGYIEFATFTNDVFLKEKNEHWITLYFICRDWKGEAKRIEPNKCLEWRWVDLDNIPEPVFCDWAKNIKKLKKMIL